MMLPIPKLSPSVRPSSAKNESVVQPYGYSVLVANNVLLDTQVNPVLSAGTFKRSNGIKIATSEVTVVNNGTITLP